MKTIDCLLLGFNEISAAKTAESLKNDSVGYKRLSYDFIRKDGIVYSIADIFNKLASESHKEYHPLNWSEVMTAVIPYLMTFLTKNGINCDYVNDLSNDKILLAEKLKTNKVLSVAITTALYPTLAPIADLIKFIRGIDKQIKIIVGGPFIYNLISNVTGKDLNNAFSVINADYYVGNMEGEQALVDLVKSIVNKKYEINLDNVYSRNKYYQAPNIIPEKNLIEDNMVNWSIMKNNQCKYISIRLSTSCPFSCSFCSFSNQQFRYLPTDIVEDNLKQLFDECGTKYIHFVDDAFNVPPKRFKEFLKMLERNNFKFKWTCMLRSQFLDEEIVDLMSKTGCDSILLGIESGSQKILDLMNKKVNIQQYIDGLSLLNKYNINSKASFIVGFPGETIDTINETKDFIELAKPTFYYVNIWYNDILSPIYQRKDEFGIRGRGFEWYHNTMDHTEAMKHVEDLFLNIKGSIWLPLFNMDYLLPSHLLSKGLNTNQMRDFIKTFSEGAKQISHDPKNAEIKYDTYIHLKKIIEEANIKLN